MIRLADIVLRYRDRLEQHYGNRMLPGHFRALDAIVDCRTPAYGQVVFDCPRCHSIETRPCSCGHRLCPVCRNFETTRWLRKQSAKLLPVRYYMVTVTLPGVLRPVAWCHQRQVYADMFAAAVEAMRDLAAGRYGFLHHRARKTLLLVQYVLRVATEITEQLERPALKCPRCRTAMVPVAFILPQYNCSTARGPPPP